MRTSHSVNLSTEVIDLLAVLEAARALSSETDLDRLRRRVEQVLSAMTGATTVRVVLCDDETGGWVLPADAAAGRPELTLAEAGERGLLPLTAFRYAERTREPMLVDDARALAEAMVIRTGNEPDPHWSESGVMVITAVTAFVLLKAPAGERNLNTVRDIVADPELLDQCAAQLRQVGGVPGRMGAYLKGLEGKERAGVMSTVARALSFLDSELVVRRDFIVR